jgi:hypothetical protein
LVAVQHREQLGNALVYEVRVEVLAVPQGACGGRCLGSVQGGACGALADVGFAAADRHQVVADWKVLFVTLDFGSAADFGLKGTLFIGLLHCEFFILLPGNSSFESLQKPLLNLTP